MSRLTVLFVLVALALSTIWPASAYGLQGKPEIRIDALDLSQFPSVLATVTVLDGAGNPVVGLPPEAFEADADGEPVAIEEVASATDEGQGLSLVITMDISGSMEGQALAQAKEAANALIEQLGPADQVAILAFHNTVEVVQPFSRDREVLAEAIEGLAAGFNTALYEAVGASVELAARGETTRRAVVLLSDGLDAGVPGQLDRSASLKAAEEAGVLLFAVGLGEEIEQAYLDELALTTGGQLMLAPEPAALTGLYETIGAILRHQYVLALDASSLPLGETPLLRIAVSHGGIEGAAEAILELPPAPPPPPPEPVVPQPEPAAPVIVASEVEEPAGSGVPVLALMLMSGAAAAVALAGLFLFRRWRRRRPGPETDYGRVRLPSGPEPPPPSVPTPEPETRPVPSEARLRLIAPPGDEQFPLRDSPVTVGYTADCNLCLPNGNGNSSERVRIWRREGRYMLHVLSHSGDVSVAGLEALWTVLEDGDEIQIGPCRLSFTLASPARDGVHPLH